MTIVEAIIEKVRALPPHEQQEVLDFIQFLLQKSAVRGPRRSIRGLWADLDISITELDIAEARREMWGNFPRDDI